MSPSYRRQRGVDTVALNMFIAPDVKRRIEEVAAATGSPQWAVVEAAIRAGTPAANGVPQEWDLPTPSTDALPGVEETRKTA